MTSRPLRLAKSRRIDATFDLRGCPSLSDAAPDNGPISHILKGAALTPLELRMTGYFQQQLVHYADGHGDRVNGIMHAIGNPIIFIGVVLPLCLVPVTVAGVHISLAPILVIPALLLWMSWDFGLGLGIAVAAIPLLWLATAIANTVSIVSMWIIAVTLFVLGWVLQIVGHQVFEGQRPTAVNNPVQSLIAPMYMVAKLYVALGFRRDLAAILRSSRSAASLYPIEGKADTSRSQ
jgi:uncharacterized membrane protein YGL010W